MEIRKERLIATCDYACEVYSAFLKNPFTELAVDTTVDMLAALFNVSKVTVTENIRHVITRSTNLNRGELLFDMFRDEQSKWAGS